LECFIHLQPGRVCSPKAFQRTWDTATYSGITLTNNDVMKSRCINVFDVIVFIRSIIIIIM
jgi:hypothetical protein